MEVLCYTRARWSGVLGLGVSAAVAAPYDADVRTEPSEAPPDEAFVASRGNKTRRGGL